MFSLLFSTSFWYDVLTVVAIIAVIYILIKFPHAKVYVFSILFALITATGIYSIININSYYSASGGIYGILTGNFDENNQLYVNEKTFELKNTTLTQKNGDTYSAKSISDEIFKINTNEYLGVFVNGSPCTYSKIEEDYFVAYYNYNFYGRDNNILFNDTLKMYFSFYDKSTQLEVMTDGGSEAVKYWGYYFNKNNFNVTLKSVKTTYDKELAIGEGDTTNYVVVKYYVDDELYTTQVYKKGESLVLPSSQYVWQDENRQDISNDYILEKNLILNAYTIDIDTWSFTQNESTTSFCFKGDDLSKVSDKTKEIVSNYERGSMQYFYTSYNSNSGDFCFLTCIQNSNGNSTLVVAEGRTDEGLTLDETSIQACYTSARCISFSNKDAETNILYKVYNTSHNDGVLGKKVYALKYEFSKSDYLSSVKIVSAISFSDFYEYDSLEALLLQKCKSLLTT